MPPDKDPKDEVTDDDLVALLGEAGISDNSEGDNDDGKPDDEKPDDDTGKEEPAEDQSKEWRQELAKMQTDHQSQLNQLTGMMGQIMQNLTTKKEPAAKPEVKDEMSKDDVKTLWGMAAQNPDLANQLTRQAAGEEIDKKFASLEKRLETTQQKREAAQFISGNLSKFSELIADNNSETIKSAPLIKERIAQLLDPSIRGTSVHGEIAVMLAAAMNPKELTQKEMSRMKLAETAREERLARLSALAGTGKRSGEPAGTKIDDNDERIAAELGFDLSDEKVRAKYLKTKKDTAGIRKYISSLEI